jgi:chromosome partitioning protein
MCDRRLIGDTPAVKIISVVQQKGGVGKTTLCVNLAAAFHRMGAQVELSDADPQQSAVAWAAPGRLPFPVLGRPFRAQSPLTWAKGILASRCDISLIDSGAGLGAHLSYLVELSDMLLLPCGPSSLELYSLRETLEHIAAVKKEKGLAEVACLLVPVRVDPRTEEGRFVVDELRSFGEPVAGELPYDAGFIRGFTSGETILPTLGNAPAGHAVTRLAEDIVSSMVWT